jgi:hypothetical protein
MKSIRLSVILSICLSVLLTSCYTTRTTTYYSSALQAVSRAQPGGDSVIPVDVPIVQNDEFYSYTDDIIYIDIHVRLGQFWFACTNKTNSPINIHWNEGAFINEVGISEKIVTGHTKTSHTDLSIPPAIIYPGSSFVGSAVPYSSSGKLGIQAADWQENYKGKLFHLILPIQSKDITYHYDFEFIISSVEKRISHTLHSQNTAYLLGTIIGIPLIVATAINAKNK